LAGTRCKRSKMPVHVISSARPISRRVAPHVRTLPDFIEQRFAEAALPLAPFPN
jgi:hypothetical protein